MSRGTPMFGLLQAIRALWYGGRWIHLARGLAFLGLGLLLAVGGIAMLIKPALPDTPQRVDLAAALALLDGGSPRHLAFQGELDFSRRIYWTGSLPYWGHCPPEEIRELAAADLDRLEHFLGCRVKIRGEASGSSPQRLTRSAGQGEQAARDVHIAFTPIDGTDGRLWAKSDSFTEGDAYEAAWAGRTEFTGVLAPLDRVLNSLPPGFPRALRAAGRRGSAALVILAGRDNFYDEKTLRDYGSHSWVPVKGSGNSIFVWVPRGIEQGSSGTITGVLEPRLRSDYRTRSKGYADFSIVTGEAVPERYGLILHRTAKDYNEAEIGRGWPILLAGALIAAAGLFIVALYLMAPKLIHEAWAQAIRSIRERRFP